ncbi:MAG: Bug family tripartite tricarboxylate transporter substrate binding protein [Gemmatimonas sp.]
MGFVRALIFAISLTAAGAAGAEDFYAGKTIEIWIGAATGGGYDVNARLVARHLPGHIPGQPAILPKNMPGGGSLRATNMVYAVAPKDGTVLGAPSRAVITMPLLGVEAAKFDANKVIWIGSVVSEDSSCIAWHGSGVSTWQDLLAKKLIVGTSGPGTSTHTYALLLIKLFDAKMELVTGYPGGKEVQLALERHEVDGACGSYSSLKTQKPEWVRDKLVNFLVLIGQTRNPEIPDVPAITEIPQSEEVRNILKVVLIPQTAGRPLFAPPDVPAERVAVLRRAFDATMKDPRFLDDASRMGLEVRAVSGEEVQRLVAEVYRLPPDIVEKARAFAEQ